MALEVSPGHVSRPASVGGRTASATPDDGVGGPVPRLPRGATLGRYVVLDCLGSGGMGVVYRAHDFALDRRVSLKLLRTSGGRDEESRRERLVAEAQALARVSHPNVLVVHDVGTWEDEVYLALEHVEGETLLSWLDRAPRSAAEIRGMFLQAARGLQAIHAAGLVHRDVKPENLLVGRDGRLRVADLGLAITAGSAVPEPARETLRPGTPGYMPLEQHRGEPLDARADQFSLAVALFEALLGQRPYGSRGASREALETRLAQGPGVEVPRTPAIPPRLRRALEAALSPDRAHRPTTLVPLIDALASPGVPATRTLGGALALGASVALVLLGLRAAAGPVGAAGAVTWIPPAYEFQAEGVEPGTLLQPEAALPPRLTGASPLRSEAREPPRAAQAQPAVTAPPEGPRPSARPDLLTIGRWAAAPEAPVAAAHAPGMDLGRLAELQNLVTALYRALSEPHAADARGPLLALSPVPVPPAAAASAPMVPSSVQWASSGLAGPSGPDWVDPSAATIAAIERRLDQQIRLNKSAPEIAQTQFALAQVLWNSSDAAELQSRALSLARQSKAALDAVSVEDSSVVELRQAVNDWLVVREGPTGKPRGGGLIRGQLQLKRESLDPTL
ncbi:MAG: protein kinase domain-containing protein [Myxococcaceae bacterium]